MILPVHPVSLPSDLKGQQNGRLCLCLLKPVIFPGQGTSSLHLLAAEAWEYLTVAALQETGQVMTCTSLGDAYRSYNAQLQVFLQRAEPVSYNEWIAAESWRRRRFTYDNNSYWLFHENVSPVAVPGTSNHGWALAVDAALLVNGRVRSVTSNQLFFAWLAAPNQVQGVWAVGTGSNAESFGFSWEGQRDTNKKGAEPWHLRLVTGDQPTRRVLDTRAWFKAAAA
jgi:hypothetical protein